MTRRMASSVVRRHASELNAGPQATRWSLRQGGPCADGIKVLRVRDFRRGHGVEDMAVGFTSNVQLAGFVTSVEIGCQPEE
jgi:hypothetical protein